MKQLLFIICLLTTTVTLAQDLKIEEVLYKELKKDSIWTLSGTFSDEHYKLNHNVQNIKIIFSIVDKTNINLELNNENIDLSLFERSSLNASALKFYTRFRNKQQRYIKKRQDSIKQSVLSKLKD